MGWCTYGESDLVTKKVGSQIKEELLPSCLLPFHSLHVCFLTTFYYKTINHEELYLVCLSFFYIIVIIIIILIPVCILLRERKKCIGLGGWENREDLVGFGRNHNQNILYEKITEQKFSKKERYEKEKNFTKYSFLDASSMIKGKWLYFINCSLSDAYPLFFTAVAQAD